MLLDAEDDAKRKDKLRQNMEALAGYHDSPDPLVFSKPEVKHARRKLDRWVKKNKLESTSSQMLSLKWPEYIDSTPLSHAAPFSVSVRLPPELEFSLVSVQVKCEPSTTVEQLIDSAFKKFERGNGEPVDSDASSCYILKVVGFSDYLIRPDATLLSYEQVRTCQRGGTAAALLLVRLTEAESNELSSALSEGKLLDYEAKPSDGAELDALSDEEGEAEGEGEEKAGDQKEGEGGNDQDGTGEDGTDNRSGVLRAPVAVRAIPQELRLSDVTWPFRVRIVGVSNCPTELEVAGLSVEVALYFGGDILDANSNQSSLLAQARGGKTPAVSSTAEVPLCREPRWPNQWLTLTQYDMGSLPANTVLGFQLVGVTRSTAAAAGTASAASRVVLAGVSVPLTSATGLLRTGPQQLRLWPHQTLQLARHPMMKGESPPIPFNVEYSSGIQNPQENSGVLMVELDQFSLPVRAEQPDLRTLLRNVSRLDTVADPTGLQDDLSSAVAPDQEQEQRIRQLVKLDPLHELSEADKQLLWRTRAYCSNFSELLPKFLQSVHWGNARARSDALKAMVGWAIPDNPVEALELLDVKYGEPAVRAYAVKLLADLKDSDLKEYLLQLVQVLKYEPYHDNPLGRMLLRRALRNPLYIGHSLFWMLRSEMQNPTICERFGIYLTVYLSNCGAHRAQLRRQRMVVDKLEAVANGVKAIKEKEKRLPYLREELAKLNPTLPSRFQCALSPRIQCTTLVVEKCKVMSSKKLPLWLAFHNACPAAEADGQLCQVMFKAGDDLRQDLMTLQMVRVMDKIWLAAGLDLRMHPYGCVATGDEQGMIDLVTNSDTISNIQTDFGGTMGAFNDTTLNQYLHENNKGDAEFERAVENFVVSCAGYCVATYVLGIGDRHPSNIMVTRSGQLFHIDFGHFLGNFKSMMGMKRERSPVVFTPEMAYVMGNRSSERFKRFNRICSQAYNILRRHGNLFLTLFTLMVPAAMPELLVKDDIGYLLEQLSLNLTEEQSTQKFKSEIKNSLSTTSRRVDNFFHNWKHH